MSGEGFVPSRPEGAPSEHSAVGLGSVHVVGHLGSDGTWSVQLVTAVKQGLTHEVRLDLTPGHAEKLAAELLEYAALIRDKQG